MQAQIKIGLNPNFTMALTHNLHWAESKILEGDTRALNLALALAASHAIQPAHVNAAAAPQGSHKHDSVEGVAHPFDVVPTTDIEVSCAALLGEPDIDIVHQSIRTLVKKIKQKFHTGLFILGNGVQYHQQRKLRTQYIQSNLRKAWVSPVLSYLESQDLLARLPNSCLH
jgi:hypothetical protein